jgi:hypothetical protein
MQQSIWPGGIQPLARSTGLEQIHAGGAHERMVRSGAIPHRRFDEVTSADELIDDVTPDEPTRAGNGDARARHQCCFGAQSYGM